MLYHQFNSIYIFCIILSSFGFIWLESGEIEVENHDRLILHVRSQFTSWNNFKTSFQDFKHFNMFPSLEYLGVIPLLMPTTHRYGEVRCPRSLNIVDQRVTCAAKVQFKVFQTCITWGSWRSGSEDEKMGIILIL